MDGIPLNNSTNTPTQSPTSPWIVTPNPTTNPTVRPTTTSQCLNVNTYNEIDNDIETLKNNIGNGRERSHFLGGIVVSRESFLLLFYSFVSFLMYVNFTFTSLLPLQQQRLAAHDFMDYDRNDGTNPYGPDGCFDREHPANAGLPEDIWCPTCALTILYETRYSTFVSRADFWIASANAVIRQTSVNNGLDLRETFLWGRKDRDACPGSGDRLPTPAGCDQVEDVFIRKMALEWRDAVALMG